MVCLIALNDACVSPDGKFLAVKSEVNVANIPRLGLILRLLYCVGKIGARHEFNFHRHVAHSPPPISADAWSFRYPARIIRYTTLSTWGRCSSGSGSTSRIACLKASSSARWAAVRIGENTLQTSQSISSGSVSD